MKEAAKSFARRFVAGHTVTRRLPASVGGSQIVVSAESQLKYLKPGRAGFDPLLLDWAERYVNPGMSVWDIGANVGVFAFSAAGRGAKVLAVEADPYMGSLLLRSRQLNPTLDVSVLACAVSDRVGFASLSIASGGRAANALSEFAGNTVPFGRAIAEVHVPAATLDVLLANFRPPALVKIDIEGAEMLALSGAETLLRSARAALIIEVAGKNQPGAAELLAAAGYRVEPLTPDNWLATPV